MTEPEKLDLTSHNLPADKTAELLRLFPEIRTEGDKIDFDKLKLVLGQTVDVGKERYGMTWPGKADCFKTIQAPSTGTLLPAPDESVDFDTTENLIIEGDNLNVLKLLQKAYLGKVKMIYIDPPYNTGNDFIYPDNYTESLQTYLEYTGQVDAEGKKFGTNSDTDGRFHSRWMNMMYPRLYLARNLLREDGVVFISIDDNEVDNLRRLCDELFGEENFVAQIIIQTNKGGQDYLAVAKTHEYLICYAKNADEECFFEIPKLDLGFPYTDVNGQYETRELRNRNPKFNKQNRPNLFYPFYINPKIIDEYGYSPVSLDPSNEYNTETFPRNSHGADSCWRWGKIRVTQNIIANDPGKSQVVAKQTRNGGWNVYEKSRRATQKAKTLWDESEVRTEAGTKEVRELLNASVFDHPKPSYLIKKATIIGTEEGIVLDFFAGSGTTAQAVLELNRDENNNNRNFILVQLPEKTEHVNFQTITEITKERVRRVIRKLNEKEAGQLPMGETQDRGFRVFKLAESNFKGWEASVPKDSTALAQQLELHIDHIREGRTSEDILYEILLKSGFPLTTPVEKTELEGKAVYSVAGGGMLICLEKELTLEVIRAMAKKKPQRVICLDLGFAGNDQLKANAVQIFKTKEVVFKTV